MKKLILVLSILLLSSAGASVAYAGSLNGYENEVISAAQGVFEADGVKYKLASSYLDQLIGYLSSEEVDLTEAQKNEVLALMQDYVASGVKEGYLVPIDGQKSASDTDGSTTEGTDTGSKSDTKQTTESNTEKDKTEVEADTEVTDNPMKASDDQKAQNEAVVKVAEEDNTNTLVQEISKQISEPEVEAVMDADQASAATDNIIKNTGFNLSRTVVMTVGMGLLMIICMIATCRLKFFAPSDE